MGRSCQDLRAFKLAMAVLLAWPWQLVLSAAETRADSPVIVAHRGLDEPARHLQPPGFSSRWCQGDVPVLALVDSDTEEEDEAGPQALLCALSPADGPRFETGTTSSRTVHSNRGRFLPSQRPLRLRC